MNLTDLFEEKSAAPPASVLHHLRLTGVRRKVVLRRRRRVVAGAAAALVAIGAFGAGATAVTGPERSVGPVEQRTIEGFPEYASGARVVAAASTELPDTELTLTFTPTTEDVAIFYRCNIPDAHPDVTYEVYFDGSGPSISGCGDDGVRFTASWRHGFQPGTPVTVTMIISSWADRPPQPLPDSGSFALAIGVPVPFEEYPFPPRPEVLAPLEEPFAGEDVPIIRSVPGDPNRPRELTLPWQTLQSIYLDAQTPGSLRLEVAGVELTLARWWDYEQIGHIVTGDVDNDWAEQYGLRLEPGQPVTITVVPEHMTGDWLVWLYPYARPAD